MSFQPTPPDTVTAKQLARVEAIRLYLHRFQANGDSETAMARVATAVQWSDSAYDDGSIFVVINWEPTGVGPHSIANIMLSGSACVIIGPRGYVKVCDYRSGTSDAKHCRKMANYLAQWFHGRCTTGCCVRRKVVSHLRSQKGVMT